MKNDKETKQKLLSCAKEEFMQKGYMQASLRTICKNAGVTTGALYFFFKDKEDLFAAFVEEPIHKLYNLMLEHYKSELLQAADETLMEKHSGFQDGYESEDVMVALQSIHYIYENYDAFLLLLQKSQGSRFDHILDQFVVITEQHYKKLAATMNTNTKPLDDYFIHWMAHMHIDIFVHMITHVTSEEQAIKNMKTIVPYLMAGWYGMVDQKKN